MRFSKNECGIEFLSSPFSSEAVDLLEEVNMSCYKIPSGEVSNIPMLVDIAKTGKPVILSSGMSQWSDLDLAVSTLLDNGCKDLSILQCSSRYPCPPEQVGLNIIQEIKSRYETPVGFSDHTLGCAAPFAAATLGATIIEKHFTLSNLMYGSDAKHSMEPSEFKIMVDGIRQIEKMNKSPVIKDISINDLHEMKNVFEKSVVTNIAIPKGVILTDKMIAVKKPGIGIPAKYFDRFIGKQTTVNLPIDHIIKVDEVEGLLINNE